MIERLEDKLRPRGREPWDWPVPISKDDLRDLLDIAFRAKSLVTWGTLERDFPITISQLRELLNKLEKPCPKLAKESSQL